LQILLFFTKFFFIVQQTQGTSCTTFQFSVEMDGSGAEQVDMEQQVDSAAQQQQQDDQAKANAFVTAAASSHHASASPVPATSNMDDDNDDYGNYNNYDESSDNDYEGLYAQIWKMKSLLT